MTLSNPAQYISGRTVQEQMNSLIDYVDQRAADVALDAIASDVAQVHQDMLDADADAAAAAASAAAAAGTLTNAVKKTGEASQSIAGDVTVAGALSGGSLATAGNATVGGTLGVTGAATVGGTLGVAGAATLSAGATVPTEATGTFSTQAANSTKVKNELDNYATMVRTGNVQVINAQKTFELPYGDYAIKIKGSASDVTLGSYQGNVPHVAFFDKNDVQLADLRCFIQADGRTTVNLVVRNADGTNKSILLGDGNQ